MTYYDEPQGWVIDCVAKFGIDTERIFFAELENMTPGEAKDVFNTMWDTTPPLGAVAYAADAETIPRIELRLATGKTYRVVTTITWFEDEVEACVEDYLSESTYLYQVTLEVTSRGEEIDWQEVFETGSFEVLDKQVLDVLHSPSDDKGE